MVRGEAGGVHLWRGGRGEREGMAMPRARAHSRRCSAAQRRSSTTRSLPDARMKLAGRCSCSALLPLRGWVPASAAAAAAVDLCARPHSAQASSVDVAAAPCPCHRRRVAGAGLQGPVPRAGQPEAEGRMAGRRADVLCYEDLPISATWRLPGHPVQADTRWQHVRCLVPGRSGGARCGIRRQPRQSAAAEYCLLSFRRQGEIGRGDAFRPARL